MQCCPLNLHKETTTNLRATVEIGRASLIPSMAQSSRLLCCFTQCGFCASGFLITMLAFLAETPEPDEPAVREALSAHPCFGAGYRHIVDGVLLAARRMAGTG
jgi:aerobic-type carbon monoxide dehydrogenase small subunit (CoxS/CutS family)